MQGETQVWNHALKMIRVDQSQVKEVETQGQTPRELCSVLYATHT
jgi:hypothetical protein